MLALRNDINDAPVFLQITHLEGKHKTNLQPTATGHRGGHRLFLSLFLFFPFPLDCIWIFNTPVCCLKEEYDQALTGHGLVKKSLYIICIFKKIYANKHALLFYLFLKKHKAGLITSSKRTFNCQIGRFRQRMKQLTAM